MGPLAASVVAHLLQLAQNSSNLGQTRHMVPMPQRFHHFSMGY
jgi:hypothetical protein